MPTLKRVLSLLLIPALLTACSKGADDATPGDAPPADTDPALLSINSDEILTRIEYGVLG